MGRRPNRRQQRGPVLFLAPTEVELAALKDLLAAKRRPYDACAAVVGVGKASAACGATVALAHFAPATTILLGCAGSLPRSGLAVGDVVVATAEHFSDEGVETAAGFFDLERLKLPMAWCGSRPIYGSVTVAQLSASACKQLAFEMQDRFKLAAGPLATVSTCSGTSPRAQTVVRRSRALAESMEGAAVALAAELQGRKLFEVRGISNRAGSRNRREWDIPGACRHAAEVALWIAAWSAVGSK